MSTETLTPVETKPAQQLAQWVDRVRWWIVAGCLVVFLVGFNGKWRIEADSALYLSLGRNLAEGKGYTYHDQPHTLAYPGLPWLHAGLFKLFGTDTLVPQHVMMLLIGLGTLGLVYRLFCLHEDRATGLIMLAGMTGVKTFYRFAFELRNDMPFTLGVMAFLCGWEAIAQRHRRPTKPFDYFLLIGGFAWAMVMKPTIWALVLSILIAGIVVAIRRPKLRGRMLLILVAVIGLIVLFRLVDPRSTEESVSQSSQYESFVLDSFTKNLPQTLDRIWHRNIPRLLLHEMTDAMFQSRLGPFNAVISLLIIVLGLALFRRRALWGAWVTVTILMMVAVLPLDRIALPILPLLVYGWWRFIVWASGRFENPRVAWTVLLLLLAAGIGNNGSRIGGYILVQRSKHFYRTYDNGEHLQIIEAAKRLKETVEPEAAALIKFNYAREVTFLSHRDVYDRSDQHMLKLGDRPVYLVEPGDETTQIVMTGYRLERDRLVAPGIWKLKRLP